MTSGRQTMLAKALYDNVAESPDELAFRRGEVLTVLERDTAGLDGWWLCTLRGRQGIAPGNRLKLLSGMESNNKVVTSRRSGESWDAGVRTMQDYDVPPSRLRSASPPSAARPPPGGRRSGGDLYDTPPPSRGSSKHSSVASLEDLGQPLYDTPTSNRPLPHPSPTPPSRHSPSPTSLPARPAADRVRNSGNSVASMGSVASSSDYDVPPSHSRQSSESLDLYDVPPSHSRQSSDGLELYDVPPSHSRSSSDLAPHSRKNSDVPAGPHSRKNSDVPIGPHSRQNSGSLMDIYDVPPSHSRQSSESLLDLYDVPPSHSRQSSEGLDTYDVPPSQRTSVLSTASSESGLTSMAPTSTCDSARSSLDVSPHDLYDLPPSRRDRTLKQLSADSGLDLYDTPPRPRPASPGGLLDGSPAPRLTQSRSADLTSTARSGALHKRGSLEHALDDVYDVPRNNAPTPSLALRSDSTPSSCLGVSSPPGVYDVPPQVTRDSVISARSDSSEEGQRLSWGGSEVPSFPLLPLELHAALETLTGLQQCCAKANSRFLAFVSSTWRRRESLETKMPGIKGASLGVKKALADFLQFAQGALANSTQLADRKLVNKLYKQLGPLQTTLQTLSTALSELEEMRWQVAMLVEPHDKGQGDSQGISDPLGQFALSTKDLTTEVKRLASLIQGNATLLFRRAEVCDGRPPSKGRPTPPPSAKQLSVQRRPLPPPPPVDRPLPPTPLDQLRRGERPSPERDLDPAYVNPAELRSESAKARSRPGSGTEGPEWNREYDYVHLESREPHEDQTPKSKSKPEPPQQQPKQVEEDKQQQEKEVIDDGEKTLERKKEIETGTKTTQDKLTVGEDAMSKRQSWKEEQEEPCRDPGPGVAPVRPQEPTDSLDGGLDYEEGPSDPAHIVSDPVDRLSAQCESALDGAEAEVDLPDEISEADLQTPVNKGDFVLPEGRPTSNDISLSSNEVSLTSGEVTLESSDKQVLVFYSGQLDTHATLLSNAVEAFFSCVEANQPPKDFISHSKFVVVSAHKLVHIGDSLHRALTHEIVRARILHSANDLCERLKHSVVATKTAALQYPSVPALQDMVDRVVDVSHAASALRQLIVQCAKL